MSFLTHYWQRKKLAIGQFLKFATPNGPAADKDTLEKWLAGMVLKEPDLEAKLKDVFDDYKAAYDKGDKPKPKSTRRSARLASMVQGAVKVVPDGKGYYLQIADVETAAAGGFRSKVQKASESAAEFLWAAKNGNEAGVQIGLIDTAITNLLAANPPVDPYGLIRDEIVRLQKSIQEFMSNPGRGEGSGYWPSSFVSSSSAS